MNKKNALATIKCELLSKNGGKGQCTSSIEGEYNDILNMYSSITLGLLEGGAKPEHVEVAMRMAVESFTNEKGEPEDNERESEEEDDEIPEEVKAGLAFMRMIGIL